MSPEVVDLIKTVFGTLTVLGGAGGIGTVVYKRRPSKSTPLAQEVELLRQRVVDGEARTKRAEEAAAARTKRAEEAAAAAQREAAECRGELRKVTDYVHDLREHIALGYPPPPPDWPEGLRL